MKDDYYLPDCVYNHAKKGDLYTEMKREMEREIRERLEKEIRFKMMKLLVRDAKRATKEAYQRRDTLIERGAQDKIIQRAWGEAYAYEKLYNDFRIALNDMKAKWGDPSKEENEK